MKSMQSLGIDKDIISLANLVAGSKFEDTAYFDMNNIITIVSFSVYKPHYVSERKTKKINILSLKLFQREIT